MKRSIKKIKKVILLILIIDLLSLVITPSAMLESNYLTPITNQMCIIEGYVYLGDTVYTATIGVELYNGLGVLVDTCPTFDGFYGFYGINPGFYRVVVPDNPGHHGSSENCTYIVNDGDYIEDLNIYLYYFLNYENYGNGMIYGEIIKGFLGFPANGTKISIYDVDDNLMGCTFVDETAEFEYSGLGIGTYNVEVELLGYRIETANVTFEYDWEEQELFFDLVEVGTGFIEVNVFDDYTYDPIIGANVSLFTSDWYYLTSGLTDIEGFYNLTGLNSGDYIVEVNATGYISQYTSSTIDYNGEAEFSNFYLSSIIIIPEFTEVHLILLVFCTVSFIGVICSKKGNQSFLKRF